MYISDLPKTVQEAIRENYESSGRIDLDPAIDNYNSLLLDEEFFDIAM